MKRWVLYCLICTVTLLFCEDALVEAKGGRAGGFSRPSVNKPAVPRVSAPAPKPSAPTAKPGNVSGYQKKAAPGSSYETKSGGKISNAGGNVSGYKTPEKKSGDDKRVQQSNGSESIAGRSYFGGGSGGLGNGGSFLAGMLVGNLLSPGYHSPQATSGVAGVPVPFSVFDWMIWLLSWVVVLSALSAIIYLGYRYYHQKKKRASSNK